MSAPELESLLSPIAGALPCGPDLEYDPAFLALQEAGAGRPEQQYGDTVIPAEQPDWARVDADARELAARTRDLRIAVWLVRSGARLAGLAGAVDGLQLVQGLVERHWEQLHPQLDASDGNDPTARVNALLPLLHPGAGLGDLRAASLTGRRGSPTVRDIELALGRADPDPGEPVPAEDALLNAIAAALEEAPALAGTMQAGLAALDGLASALDARLPASQGIDFQPLRKLLHAVADAALRASGGASAATGSALPVVVANTSMPASAGTGPIATREDAMRALERACEWIERNEPSNPAPLLIRRSQRLMSKNFIDIVRDLIPDGLDQIEKLAGTHQS
jgi:type VI secretion system protein ImpA